MADIQQACNCSRLSATAEVRSTTDMTITLQDTYFGGLTLGELKDAVKRDRGSRRGSTYYTREDAEIMLGEVDKYGYSLSESFTSVEAANAWISKNAPKETCLKIEILQEKLIALVLEKQKQEDQQTAKRYTLDLESQNDQQPARVYRLG